MQWHRHINNTGWVGIPSKCKLSQMAQRNLVIKHVDASLSLRTVTAIHLDHIKEKEGHAFTVTYVTHTRLCVATVCKVTKALNLIKCRFW